MKTQSMTGYGKGETDSFRVEIRSINHKNLDIKLSLPQYLYCHELDIKKEVRKKFQRGRFEVYVFKQEEGKKNLTLNMDVAREYLEALKSLKKELSIDGDISLNNIATHRDVFLYEEEDIELPKLFNALGNALDELEKSRIDEGVVLVNDITGRIKILNKCLSSIKSGRKEFIDGAKERLYERLKEILENTPVDETRLIQETAVLIERSDITEEIVRAESHLIRIDELSVEGGAVGKKIDFFVQELRREVNTIGAKASDIDIIRQTVDMKNELEKIREQVQNIQ
jgi:uncharacterized protein (TIGR00255 family)